MADEPDEMQETEQGATIPVPTKADVLRDLERVAKPRRQNGGPSPKR
jgi:hypothetical protein